MTERGNSQLRRGADGVWQEFCEVAPAKAIQYWKHSTAVFYHLPVIPSYYVFVSLSVTIFFQIKELNLDNCRATIIEGLTSDFKNLESLSLINVGLTTLKGLPSLPSLKKVMQYINLFQIITLLVSFKKVYDFSKSNILLSNTFILIAAWT